MLLNLIQTGNEYNYKINVQVMSNGRGVWIEVAMYIYMLYMYHYQNPLYRIDLIIFKFKRTIKFFFVNFFSCPIFKRSTTKCHHFIISKVIHWSLKFSVNNFLLILYIITLWLPTWSFCSWSFKMSCAALNIIT